MSGLGRLGESCMRVLLTRPRATLAVLLAILRDDWDRLDALLRRRTPEAGSFVSLVRSCDVHPWVHARLEEHDRLGFLGPDASDRLESLRAKCRTDNLLLLARLEVTLRVFALTKVGEYRDSLLALDDDLAAGRLDEQVYEQKRRALEKHYGRYIEWDEKRLGE